MENKIEISLSEYKQLLLLNMKFVVLRRAMISSVRKYVSGNGLYLDSNLLEIFALLFPEDYAERVAQLQKEGDAE